MIPLVCLTDPTGSWRFAAYKSSLKVISLQREEVSNAHGPHSTWITVRGMTTSGPGTLGIMVTGVNIAGARDPVFHVANLTEAEEILRVAVRHHLAEEKRRAESDAQEIAEEVTQDRIVDQLEKLGKENEPPPGWQGRVLAAVDPDAQAACLRKQAAKLDEANQLITDMMRVINGKVGPMHCPAYSAAQQSIAARVNVYFGAPAAPGPTPQEIRNAEIEAGLRELLTKFAAGYVDAGCLIRLRGLVGPSSSTEPTPTEIARRLLDAWQAACEAPAGSLRVSPEEFSAWSGATKDILIANGLEWSVARDCYGIPDPIGGERRVGNRVDARTAASVATDQIVKLYDSLLSMTEKRDRIAGEKADLKAKVAALEVKLERFTLWIITHSKHGPNGSGTRGPCEPDCTKCAAEKDYYRLRA